MNDFFIDVFKWMAGIIGSLIVVYITQLISASCFVPKKELSDIMRRLSFLLGYYANLIANPEPRDANKEAGLDLRSAAMDLKAFIDIHPKCKYKALTATDLDNIATRIVVLSNSINHKNALEKNVEQLQDLRKTIRGGNKNNKEDIR